MKLDQLITELKKIISNSERRRDEAQFPDDVNVKETKFALESLFDKEVSKGRTLNK